MSGCCPSQIGNIKPFLKIDYPQCWGIEQPQTCNESTVDSIEYVEICGIIAGMLALGFAGDISECAMLAQRAQRGAGRCERVRVRP